MFRRLALFLALLTCAPSLALAQAAMVFGNDATSTPDAVSLPTSTDQWFTQGNGTSIQGTDVPSYWVNKVGGEFDTLISNCTSLNMTIRNQALGCIQQMIGSKGHEIGYSAAGTYTWVDPVGTYTVKVRAWGAGAGGGGSSVAGGAAGGGQGGGYSETYISVTPGTSYTIVVGSGGSGGGGGTSNTGSAGAATSFATSTVYAAGGAPGTGSSGSGSLGTGGTASGAGGFGGNGAYQPSLSLGLGGYGGGALFGAPITPFVFSAQGLNGACPGGGGGGGANGGGGGTGCAGEIFVEW